MPVREPAVSRPTLLITAAIVWAAVGLFLCLRAINWLPLNSTGVAILAAGGLLGAFKGFFVFARLAVRNAGRIAALSPHKEKICVFAFQAWSSYLIALTMIGLGLFLRRTPLSRSLLAGIYLVVGVGLIVGAWKYAGASRKISENS